MEKVSCLVQLHCLYKLYLIVGRTIWGNFITYFSGIEH